MVLWTQQADSDRRQNASALLMITNWCLGPVGILLWLVPTFGAVLCSCGDRWSDVGEVRVERTLFSETSVFGRKGKFIHISYGTEYRAMALLDFRDTEFEQWGGKSTTGAGSSVVFGQMTLHGPEPGYPPFVTDLNVEFRIPETLRFGVHKVSIQRDQLAHFELQRSGAIAFVGLRPMSGEWEVYKDGELDKKMLESAILRALSEGSH